MTDTSWCSLLFPTLKAHLCSNCLLLEQKIVLSKICLNSGSRVCQSKNLGDATYVRFQQPHLC